MRHDLLTPMFRPSTSAPTHMLDVSRRVGRIERAPETGRRGPWYGTVRTLWMRQLDPSDQTGRRGPWHGTVRTLWMRQLEVTVRFHEA